VSEARAVGGLLRAQLAGGRRLWLGGVVGLAVAVAGLRLVLSKGMKGPFVFADEVGYLLDGRYLSGVGPTPHHPFVPFYRAGYALLVAPLSWLFDDPGDVYRGALVVNALLGAALAVLIFAVAREVFGLARGRALIGAAAVSAYPAYLLNADIAWSENLLPPLVALHVLLVYRALRRPTAWSLLAPGVSAAALMLTHPRTVPVLVTTAGLLVVMGVRHAARPRHCITALAGLVAMAAATEALNAQVSSAVYRGPVGGAPGGPDPGAGVLLRVLEDPSTWGRGLLDALGQVWYLCATTVGLFPLGLLYLALLVRRRRSGEADASARAATAIFVIVSFALTVVLTGLSMANGQVNSSDAIYGRYVEPFGVVVTLAGLAWLLEERGWRARLAGAGAAAAATLVLALVVHAAAPGLDHGPVNPVVTLAALLIGGVSSWTDLFGFDLLFANVVALGGLAAVVLTSLRRPAVAAGLLAAWFVVNALIVSDRVIQPFARSLTSAATFQPILKALPAGQPIGYELAAWTEFGLPQYQFADDEHPFLLFDSRDGDPPPSEVVLSSMEDRTLRVRGASIAGLETYIDQVVWVLPGPLRDQLAREGRVFPRGIGDPLPEAARRSRIQVVGGTSGPIRIESGRRRTLRLSVQHIGGGSPWRQPGYVPATKGAGYVLLTGTWYAEAGDGPRLVWQVAALPRTLAPGERSEVDLTLDATNADGRPLPPGNYVLRFSPYQDGLGFFDDFGDTPLALPVVVSPGGPTGN
jgi:hypothetical protein